MAQGAGVTLSFVSARPGGPLASAEINGGGCGLVELRIRGRPAPPLQGSPNLIGKLSSALGLRLG